MTGFARVPDFGFDPASRPNNNPSAAGRSTPGRRAPCPPSGPSHIAASFPQVAAEAFADCLATGTSPRTSTCTSSGVTSSSACDRPREGVHAETTPPGGVQTMPLRRGGQRPLVPEVTPPVSSRVKTSGLTLDAAFAHPMPGIPISILHDTILYRRSITPEVTPHPILL